MIKTGRRSGRTSAAMKAAPQGAIFVWCNSQLDYPRSLAKFLGRPDLTIIAPPELEAKTRGRRVPVVFDHWLEIPEGSTAWSEA